MENKLGTEPAFPKETVSHFGTQGMSKRFYAACAAMQGMLSNMQFLEANAITARKEQKKPDEYLIFTAYSLADELLKQENET